MKDLTLEQMAADLRQMQNHQAISPTVNAMELATLEKAIESATTSRDLRLARVNELYATTVTLQEKHDRLERQISPSSNAQTEQLTGGQREQAEFAKNATLADLLALKGDPSATFTLNASAKTDDELRRNRIGAAEAERRRLGQLGMAMQSAKAEDAVVQRLCRIHHRVRSGISRSDAEAIENGIVTIVDSAAAEPVERPRFNFEVGQ